jgi:WD40 repeat protein
MKKKLIHIILLISTLFFSCFSLSAGDFSEDTLWTTPYGPGTIESIDLSPDESQVAVCLSEISTLRIYDSQDGNLLFEKSTDVYPPCLRYSDDGEFLYVSTGPPTHILVFDTKKYNIIEKIDALPQEWGTNVSMDINSSGTRLILGTSGDSGIALYDLIEKKVIKSRTHSLAVDQVIYSPDDSKILVRSRGGSDFGILDAETLETIQAIKLEGIQSIALSPDGKYVAASRSVSKPDWSDNRINVYDMNTYDIISTFDKHTSDVHSMTFTPDSKYIISQGSPGIFYWDIYTGKDLYLTNTSWYGILEFACY